MGLGARIENYLEYPVIAEAVLRNHRILLFDNRGIGGTSLGGIKKPDMGVYTADAAAVMGALGIERAHIFGVSMGGMIAQQMALDYPETVEKLVLACTWAGGPTLVRPSQELYDYLTVPGRGRMEDLK
jgi:pimeloyl-ACP methyl ester carboxylesterase